MPDIPDDIHDTLRAMLRTRMRSDAAYRGVAKRVARDAAAHDAGLIRKARKAAIKAAIGPKAEPKPVVKIDKQSIGRMRFDENGKRHIMDRHGRWWKVERSEHGWHAYGPIRRMPNGTKLQPVINRATSEEIRERMRTIASDTSRYNRFV